MTKDQIFDEVRRLPPQEQLDVLMGLVEIVAPALTPEQEQGLVEALDEADAGKLQNGSEVFEAQRSRLRGGR